MPIRAQAMPEPWRVRFTNGVHTATADTHKNGVGGGAGLRPHELLEAALASCMTITARMATRLVQWWARTTARNPSANKA